MTDLIPYAGIVWPVEYELADVLRGDTATGETFIPSVWMSEATPARWDDDALEQLHDEGIELPEGVVPVVGEAVPEVLATFLWNLWVEEIAERADEMHQADVRDAELDYEEDVE